MNLNELDISNVVEAQLVWARKGRNLVRKYRCTVGQRAPIDIKKRLTLRKTKSRMGKRMARKAQRTKKFNPASRALKRLNKPARRR